MRLIKEVLLLILVLIVGVVALFCISYPFRVDNAEAETFEGHHSSQHLVRETADEDGATFAAVYDLTGVTTGISGAFADKDSSTVLNGGPFRIFSRGAIGYLGEGFSPGAAWILTFAGKNYNDVNDTFSFTVVGWSKTNGMLQVLAEGNCFIGSQAVVTYPDGGDALGELISETSVTYTHATTTFTVTNGGFAGAVAGMMVRITGTGYTDDMANITTVTDANNIIVDVISSSGNGTDSTVQANPAFWVDTIVLDETTKWPEINIFNATADNEIATLVFDATGIEWLQVIIYDADAATGEQAGDITVYGRRY